MKSSGFLIYDIFGKEIKYLLVHPGGPFWRNKQNQGWGIPKGKQEEGETLLETAIREVKEEIGQIPYGRITHYLGSIKQRKRKVVCCFAVFGTVSLPITSVLTTTEWPKKSGNYIEVPEIEEARWFTAEEAKSIMIKGQYEFIERLLDRLNEEE